MMDGWKTRCASERRDRNYVRMEEVEFCIRTSSVLLFAMKTRTKAKKYCVQFYLCVYFISSDLAELAKVSSC